MKIDYLQKLDIFEQLDYFTSYLENRKNYPPDEQKLLDQYFEGL
ncbi:hypothetical protein JM79_3259 [Gramella sp. Hel_I_59]|nr:hypothetical protein [Gramella sp. Hel_I_59]TQI72237.1 hypothetical protein JM79_3193 [Gramella sp. Hel_I_59]TQI72301.1 hypothetical protein JM79_3259 [Gramella sp. Hel_I_59]